MRIAVCIKQVPGTTGIKIDPETNTLVRHGIENIINPFDSYALEEGVSLKERLMQDGFSGEIEVVALTMGPPQAEQVLKEAISTGIDRAILLSDRAFAGADTWATALTLSRAIQKLEDCRLVIFGKQTLDGDTGQVGPEFAQQMNIPFTGYVSSVQEISKNRIKVKRLMEDRYEIIELKLPAAISVNKDINTPRVPSLRGKLKAKNTAVPVWGIGELGAGEDEVGLSGSYTRVVKIFTPRTEHEVQMIEGTPGEQAEKLYGKLKNLNIVGGGR
ncbi:MAG: electron transfer flavoprotein subunit beta/FixA family protein [Actinobacteria bacterium]|nr:electron transfer flavoprotein subunit beta/FixA family protein [Actinomycetota bacterium]